ncbi:DUF1176 domain-containing protein [Azohydromonas aeria]|uniref:DUF1176 domain-containing protein n=1 Tax=Azohydromonas aeria TaxID=2590212 RepID=UPI0018DFEC79|nr:DUF1176 domain-containing protein [Azohydromonas aeria]
MLEVNMGNVKAFAVNILAVSGSLCFSGLSQAADPSSLTFSHHDWELACDNTRTCRAAGYQSDDQQWPVSVLFTRKAGPNQPVTAQLQVAGAPDNAEFEKQGFPLQLSMKINGQPQGQVSMPADKPADLSPAQTAALLAALSKTSTIEWSAGKYRWQLSDKGASAVLLKMDDFQKRVGTTGALVKKGAAGEDSVLPPLPVPVIKAAPLATARPDDAQWLARHSRVLLPALRATVKSQGDECQDLIEPRDGAPELQAERLSDSKMLVSTRCWLAAYNAGSGFWVVNDKPPFQPELVTTSGSDHGKGVIAAGQKGRGIGDCWSNQEWTWDGRRFVHTRESTSGQCRLFPGGAWDLPTLVIDVRR